ncbi:MAG: M42 family metallopeptidase [Roseobacter sp.]
MKDRLRTTVQDLMLIPGLSGHEDRVRRHLRAQLDAMGVHSTSDRLGNLVASFSGEGPSVMLFAHMDQLGFIVRKIDGDGCIRLHRMGGVPERALAAQEVLICVGEGKDVPGIIANKNHHATGPEDKYRVATVAEIYVDAGFRSAAEAAAAGVQIGTPVVYAPVATLLENDRIAGTSVDDRAACAVLLEVARVLKNRVVGPPVHLAFTVLEEFNLRGAQPLAQQLLPDIAIQLDLMLASDTPDMETTGEMVLGGGPGMSLYSFHGRGTLNGVIPHPALVDLFTRSAKDTGIALQRSAQVGVLTDLSYVQLVGAGVAAVDLGFPMRYSHSAREVCDLNDLVQLTELLVAGLARITPDFSLERDRYT